MLFLLFGLFFSTLVVITAMMPFSLVLVLWLMADWGLYYEFIEIAIFSYASRHHNPSEQSRYFGIIFLFLNLAYVFGPIAGGYFAKAFDIQHTFTALGLIMLTCAFITAGTLIHFKVTGRLHKAILAEFDL